MSDINDPYYTGATEREQAPTSVAATGFFIPDAARPEAYRHEVAQESGGSSSGYFARGTRLKARIEAIEIANTRKRENGESVTVGQHLALRLTVTSDGHKGHILFQKLKVFEHLRHDLDQEKAIKAAQRAQKMLYAIEDYAQTDAVRKAIQRGRLDNAVLSALVGTEVGLTLGVWEIDGDDGKICGNWISALVSPALIEVTPNPVLHDDPPRAQPSGYGPRASQGAPPAGHAHNAAPFNDSDIPF